MRNKRLMLSAALLTMTSANFGLGGDHLSGTYLDPALQRPDFFSHQLWKSTPEYRRAYNRPRYYPGYLAYLIEPSSQEAMAWRSNYCNGNYANCSGPYVPHYNYPKPWEALNTRARPDTAKPNNE
ncbi:MAG: hypothetical protein ABL921_06865 [Pirellula sp.]